MNILFVARHFTYFRNFESVIRLLAERGHDVHLAAERDETIGGSAMVAGLTSDYPNVTAGEAPGREDDEWRPLVTTLRLAVDYLRYLEPMYDGTPALRSRAAERAPAFAVRFGDSAWARPRPLRAGARALLRRAEDALPSSARIEAFLRDRRPDVMLITPLVGVIESPQPDYVRAARALGIPAALCVWSWDHLSSKALIRDLPDRVLVWNDIQRDEAVRLHRVPAERVVVTGAQCFDRWFDRQPSRTREQFCAEAGLPVDRPFVLYVCSALFRGSPAESGFVRRWIEALRASPDPLVRTVGILVRPHPQRMKEWDDADVEGLGADVAVWGGNPVTEQARDDYFDALFHSAAVVGLNTSAFLEAAIAGKPVLTILPPEFAANQEGTIHFHYLMSAGGGLLQVSRSLDEHAVQLAVEMHTSGGPPLASTSFVRAFLRPHGLTVAATPVFADAVEALAAHPVPVAPPVASPVGRTALRALRGLDRSPRGRLWLMDAEQRRSHDRHEAKVRGVAAQQQQRVDERAHKAAAKDARVQQKRQQVEAWRRDKRQRPGA